MSRTILHSDMNCFYASVEMLHHPELAGKPMAVGGDPEARHGIVLTANYIAKRAGVKTGMALWQARQVCPEIIFVPPRMDLYLRFSRMAQEIYSEYTDQREPFGIDESWLDVTASTSVKGDGMKIAKEISSRIKYELGVTVSIGVSWNKIFAKLGSDYKKPDAITEFSKDNYKDIAWKLPVGDLLMVGRSTERTMKKLGICTIGDLAGAEPSILETYLGKMGLVLHTFANGWDETPVLVEGYKVPIKSIGNSTTTPRDLVSELDVKIILMALSESVGARLRENGFQCRTVEISIRDNGLYHFTRQCKLDRASNLKEEIARTAFDGIHPSAFSSQPSPEYSTDGMYAKCWVRTNDDIFLVKKPSQTHGTEIFSEVMASELAKYFCSFSVSYYLADYHGNQVTICPIFTNEDIGFIPSYKFIKSGKRENVSNLLNVYSQYESEDDFRRMLIFDALILNEDRHSGNYGFLFSNNTGQILGMSPVFDNNRSLLFDMQEYDEKTIRNKIPRLGGDFNVLANKLLTPDIRSDLVNLRNFSFQYREGIPEKRLEMAEKLINSQIENILEGIPVHAYRTDL